MQRLGSCACAHRLRRLVQQASRLPRVLGKVLLQPSAALDQSIALFTVRRQVSPEVLVRASVALLLQERRPHLRCYVVTGASLPHDIYSRVKRVPEHVSAQQRS